MAIQECYSCLSLVLAMDFCSVNIFLYISYSKKTQKYITKKTMKYSEKNEFIEKRWGGPSFKLWGGVPSPIFKLRGGPVVTGPGVLVTLLHHAVKFKQTNQTCSPWKLNQSINVEWRLDFWWREKLVNWKNTEDDEIIFFKAHANRFRLISKLIRRVKEK